MSRNIIITEQQLEELIARQFLEESFFQGQLDVKKLLTYVAKGYIAALAAITLIGVAKNISEKQKEDAIESIAEAAPIDQWELAADDVIVTVYNAVKGQCNNDPSHTASMFRLNMQDVASHRIIAMERTFMKELGLKYGDVVKLEGTYKGLQDGVYQIQDTMNKRFARKHKVDILVPNNIKIGGTAKGERAKIYVLKNPEDTAVFKADMAPEHHK